MDFQSATENEKMVRFQTRGNGVSFERGQCVEETGVSELDRDLDEALERAHADDLGVSRSRYRREPEPLPGSPGWGPLSFLQPATPWHLVAIGVLLLLVGRFMGRVALAGPVLLTVAAVLLAIAILSLLFLPRGAHPKRWRGRIVELDTSWQARLYRRIYRR